MDTNRASGMPNNSSSSSSNEEVRCQNCEKVLAKNGAIKCPRCKETTTTTTSTEYPGQRFYNERRNNLQMLEADIQQLATLLREKVLPTELQKALRDGKVRLFDKPHAILDLNESAEEFPSYLQGREKTLDLIVEFDPTEEKRTRVQLNDFIIDLTNKMVLEYRSLIWRRSRWYREQVVLLVVPMKKMLINLPWNLAHVPRPRCGRFDRQFTYSDYIPAAIEGRLIIDVTRHISSAIQPADPDSVPGDLDDEPPAG